jgi:hypothetical protein
MHFECVECFHINGLSASHHYVVVFIEFSTSGWFGEQVTKVVVGGNVRVVDTFFFGPSKNDKVFHVDVSGASCWLLCVGELSCASVVSEDFGWTLISI